MADASSNNGPFHDRLKKALLSVKKQQIKLQKLEGAQKEPIAIVGIGCRFPGSVDSPTSFWEKLTSGFDAIGEVPPNRWSTQNHFHETPQTPGKMYSRFGAFLDSVDCFDPQFFRITPREALSMDPQQRILMEVAWEAIEDAGIDPTTLRGTRTGVFVGLTVVDYAQLLTEGDHSRMDTYFATGNVANMASGRLAYFFGFNGPSLSIDTACSSSLISTHQACQSLRTGDADMALAAGVNLILTPDNSIAISQAKMLAPDGRCKTFDASADGYSRGEGCGVVLLKRLSDAIEANDRIYATVLGSAIGQDGASSGLTVPHGPSQQSILKKSLENARLTPGEVGYIEAHGTGTALGDPIEMDSVGQVYSEGHSTEKPLIVGSLKSNLGHMESAAGIGGIIKAALSVYHGKIPQHLNLNTLNPAIQLDGIPAIIPNALTDWPAAYEKRIAGVSSFGSSGAIGHVLIGNHEPTPKPNPQKSPRNELFTLSAKNETCLRTLAQRYLDFFKKHPNASPVDVCATAAIGRTDMEERFAVVVPHVEALQQTLKKYIETGEIESNSAEPDLQTMAQSYIEGASLDWTSLYPSDSFDRISLPTYPFERKKFWVDDLHAILPAATQAKTVDYPRLGEQLPAIAAEATRFTWQCAGQTMQAVDYLQLAQAAAEIVFPQCTYSVDTFEPKSAFQARSDTNSIVQTTLKKTTETSATIHIHAKREEEASDWQLLAELEIQVITQTEPSLEINQDLKPELTETTPQAIDFGVMFFNGTEQPGKNESYRLINEATQFADYHNFSSVWIPERHFTEFGGIYPNPSVMHAALAQCTQQIRLMAGSVVLPLHSLFRIAEEWAMVDNLSNGRVGISFASGWHPNDFTLMPDNYEERHRILFDSIEQLKALWQGQSIQAPNGKGELNDLRIYPTPVQPELPLWITAAGNPKTFASAGSIGANLLTHLLDHDVDELAEKIALYRSERQKHGFDPNEGRVTVMLHTFLGDNHETVRQIVKPPFTQFLKENIHLLKGLAASRSQDVDIDALQGDSLDEFVSFVFDRFYDSRALLGTPESSLKMVNDLIEAGVNEIACLLDFGPSTQAMLDSLPKLLELKSAFAGNNAKDKKHNTPTSDNTFASLIESWKDRSISSGNNAPSDSPQTYSPEAIDSLAFLPSWQAAELTPGDATLLGKRWILCGEPTQFNQALTMALEDEGIEVYPMHYRVPLIPHIPGSDSVDFADPQECDAFIRRVTDDRQKPLDGILYLWEQNESLEQAMDRLPYIISQKMMACAQLIESLQKWAPNQTTKIWTVTEGAHAVHNHERGDPIQSMAMSMVKVIPIEQGPLWGGFLDLDAQDSSEDKVSHIVKTITNRSGEDRIAIRAGTSFVHRLERTQITTSTPQEPNAGIQPDKHYLITGGSGGLGLTTAEWLVEQGAQHITLLGRRPSDDFELPQSLQTSKAQIDYHSVDISHAEAVAQLKATLTEQNKPEVAGIFHAAGSWDDCPIEQLSAAQLESVLAPKVSGTWNLFQTFAGESLEFIKLYSAFSSIMPAHGQANYAAANGFLDAFAHYAQTQGTHVQAINWGPWSEVGFANTVHGQRAHAQLESFGIRRFSPAQGMQLLNALLNHTAPQVSLIDVQWKTFFAADPQAALMPLLADRVSETQSLEFQSSATDSPTLTALKQAASSETQLNVLTESLKNMIGKVLHIQPEELPTDQSLLKIGVDSLIAVQVKNTLEREFGLTLPLTKILEGPTLETLATDLLTRLKVNGISTTQSESDNNQPLEEIEI